MPDFEQPIVGDAGAFERGAKEILARAEAALRASVQTLGEVRSLAGQIREAATASAGEERAADAINRKAQAAERATAAIARQNAELRAAGSAAAGEDRAAAAAERRAVAAERELTVRRQLAVTPGQGSLFDETAGGQPRLFPLTPPAAPLLREYQGQAQALADVNARAREAADAEGRLAIMGREAAAEQARLAAAEREAGTAGAGIASRVSGMARGYAEFLGVASGVGLGIGAFHNIVEGAQQAQQGVQDLKRVLHEVDPDAAIAGFRSLSQEFNVPIETVAQAQFGFARVTQNQTSALEATRAALAATKLDAIGAGDSVKYLTVAIQAFHLSGQQLSGQGGVFDQLENVSRRMGVPVGQLLQSFRALPAVANTGGDMTQFIALAATMVRASGRSGTEVNTAIARAATNFVPRNAEEIRTRFGLDPTESITQLLIDAAEKSRNLNQAQRRDLANLIGGPLRGGSTILGLLNRPDVLEQALHQADPRTAAGATAEEMRAVMGRIDTQVQEVGRHLAAFGAALAQSGVLNGLGVMAHLLTTIVDKATVFADIFHAIPGHNIIAPLAEGAGAVALARRFNVGERLGGPFAFLAGPLSSPTTAGRQALNAERSAINDALARTRTQAAGAAMDMRIAAGTGNEEAAVAAQQRLNDLRARESLLVQESAALANRTAEQQLEVNAAREREVTAQGSGLILPAGAAGAAAGAAGAQRATTRDALEAMGFGAVGSRMGSMFAQSEESVALESMGFGAAGRAGMGALAGLGSLGGALKGVGALGVYFAAFQQLQGTVETHGNVFERLAGGGRSVLGMFGIHTAPITNDENRAAGIKDAQEYVRGLVGGLDYNTGDLATMSRRRAALTRQINRVDAQDGGNKYRADAQLVALQAELDHETALEQAAAAAAAARRTGARQSPTDLLGLNAKELQAMQAEALLPMTDVGDDRGLASGIAVAEAFATLGHRKKRADLLQKADQAIKANVQAITSELSDNLALAGNAGDRAQAYDQALAEADRLLHSSSPAQRRAGELLTRQVDIQRAQDAAQTRATATGIATAEHPGRTVGLAQRAAENARRNYLDLADKGLANTQQGRDAYQKYLEAQNAIDDAVQQRIQLDTASAQARQQSAAGKDRALVTGLQRQIAAARAAAHPNANSIAALENQLADAQAQLAQQTLQDANAAIDAHYQLAEAQTDNPLTQAIDEYRRLAAQHLDPTNPNAPAIKAAQLAQAAQRIRQTRLQQSQDAIAGQQAMADALSDPSDQVALARHAETAARQRLAAGGFQDPGQLKSAQANVRKTHEDTVRARQQQSFDDIEFNASIGRYTTDMEVAALRRLESTVKNNRALKRQIQSQIYSLTHQDSSAIELNLGNIRLPSPYEVNRAIREASGARASARGMAVHNSVNVTVTGDADIGKVAGAIDGVIGTSTRSALRAAGVL